MTTTINASTTNGLVQTADTSGALALQTANTTAVTVDSSQNVGIGTTSPASKLDVKAGSGSVISRSTSGVNFKAFYDDGRTTYTSVNYDGISTTGAQDFYLSAGQSVYFRANSNSSSTDVGAFDTSANFKFNSGYGSVATAYGCRAWVSWAGSTGARYGSGNVSSVTRNGTGNYTVNFTTAMPDTNYAIVCGGSRNNSRTDAFSMNFYNLTTTSFYIDTAIATVSYVDAYAACIAVFR